MFSKSNGNEGNDVLDSPRVAQWEDEESEVDEPTFNELEQNQLVGKDLYSQIGVLKLPSKRDVFKTVCHLLVPAMT